MAGLACLFNQQDIFSDLLNLSSPVLILFLNFLQFFFCLHNLKIGKVIIK